MSQQGELATSLDKLSINSSNDKETATKLPAAKPKAAYDKVALKERWKVLGKDAEQSKLFYKIAPSVIAILISTSRHIIND